MAFGHVGLQVLDLERSRAYYRDVIGLVEIERQARNDLYLKQLTGYPNVELEIAVFVESHSGILLELLEYRGVLRTPINAATANPGTGHVCFEVDDVDAIYARGMAAGHKAVSAPVTPTSGRWMGGRSVYLVDPDGIRVELVQRGPSGDAPSSAPTIDLGVAVRPPLGDVQMESVFLVEATFTGDADERRRPYRATHLRRLADLKRRGVIIEGGAFLDALSTSLMLIRAASAAEARQVAEDDIYVSAGVWENVQVRPFGRIATPETPPD